MNKPASARATNLSVMGLIASIALEATRYALSINRGIVYFVFEACSVVCFVPGLLCALYYLSLQDEPSRPLMVRGQKLIVSGILSFIYVGIGSNGVANISSEVFHADLLPEVWLWLGRIGLQAGALLMGIGVLITRRGWSLVMSKNLEDERQSWGKTLQGFTFLFTILGLFLSAFSFSVLDGLIAIIVGLVLYPIGYLVDKLSKPKVC